MNIFWRRITYALFFTIFFIVSPLLILYSLGYRYNFSTNNIEKNGAFYIKSYPKNADIYINNEKNKKKTPNQIININPNTYKLKVEKEDYIPWEKNLEIKKGETTFAENIVLFLENQEKNILGLGSDNILINNDKNKYAYLNDNILWITNIEEEKNYNIYKFNKNYKLIDWSSDNKNILIKDNKDYYIFDINQKNLELFNIINIDKVLFDNEYIYYLKNNNLYKYNIQYNNKDLILENVDDFIIENNYLIIQRNENSASISVLEKKNLKEIQTINNLNIGKLHILSVDDKKIIFNLGSKLYIKYTWKDIISIPASLSEIYGDKLLISNGYEIWLYNYKEDYQEIIDRSSKIVSDIIWHPSGSYFLTEINEETIISELDTRDNRNTITILNNALKKSYIFNKKGNKLFIITPEENFYLTIQ